MVSGFRSLKKNGTRMARMLCNADFAARAQSRKGNGTLVYTDGYDFFRIAIWFLNFLKQKPGMAGGFYMLIVLTIKN